MPSDLASSSCRTTRWGTSCGSHCRMQRSFHTRDLSPRMNHGPLPKKWSKFQSDSLKRLHDELIELRHQTIAHSDAAVRHVYVYPPNTVPSLIPDDKLMFAIRTIKLPPERFIEI